MVLLDDFSPATRGKEYVVLALKESQSCQSGLLVFTSNKRIGAVDSHWLIFVRRPTPLPEWDDDIPFDSSTYRSTPNGKCINFTDKSKENICF